MPVTIDQIEVEPPAELSQPPSHPPGAPPPDPHELERILHSRRERLARVRAH
jgi:hypothetical protein